MKDVNWSTNKDGKDKRKTINWIKRTTSKARATVFGEDGNQVFCSLPMAMIVNLKPGIMMVSGFFPFFKKLFVNRLHKLHYRHTLIFICCDFLSTLLGTFSIFFLLFIFDKLGLDSIFRFTFSVFLFFLKNMYFEG